MLFDYETTQVLKTSGAYVEAEFLIEEEYAPIPR